MVKMATTIIVIIIVVTIIMIMLTMIMIDDAINNKLKINQSSTSLLYVLRDCQSWEEEEQKQNEMEPKQIFKLFVKIIKMIKFLNLSLIKKNYIFGAEVRPHRSLQASSNDFQSKGERFSKTWYVHCLCSSKTHVFLKLYKVNIIFI